MIHFHQDMCVVLGDNDVAFTLLKGPEYYGIQFRQLMHPVGGSGEEYSEEKIATNWPTVVITAKTSKSARVLLQYVQRLIELLEKQEAAVVADENIGKGQP